MREYGWDIDLAGLAAIRRGDCISRVKILDDIRVAYDTESGLPPCWPLAVFAAAVVDGQDSWCAVVGIATRRGSQALASAPRWPIRTRCAPELARCARACFSMAVSAPVPTAVSTARAPSALHGVAQPGPNAP
ncbi:hypothetical protein [Haloechinothrix halophila]|uniref:hypothetical protein n=1 Tax=Haloechinothrix halophila TaxID=1069073 RepID=UPI000A0665B8